MLHFAQLLGAINLFDPRIPQESLDALAFRECTAGVVARMKPHPDDLRPVLVDETPDWSDGESGARWWESTAAD